MISSIALFKDISAAIPDPKIFFWIAPSVSDPAAVHPSGIKMLLPNSVSTFFINGKSPDINGVRKLRNPPSLKFLYFLTI